MVLYPAFTQAAQRTAWDPAFLPKGWVAAKSSKPEPLENSEEQLPGSRCAYAFCLSLDLVHHLRQYPVLSDLENWVVYRTELSNISYLSA